jgi:hypothetical protein
VGVLDRVEHTEQHWEEGHVSRADGHKPVAAIREFRVAAHDFLAGLVARDGDPCVPAPVAELAARGIKERLHDRSARRGRQRRVALRVVLLAGQVRQPGHDRGAAHDPGVQVDVPLAGRREQRARVVVEPRGQRARVQPRRLVGGHIAPAPVVERVGAG